MKHRITDKDGRGVELDDENPEHKMWAIKALMLMSKYKHKTKHPLAVGLEAFIERCKRTTLGEGQCEA